MMTDFMEVLYLIVLTVSCVMLALPDGEEDIDI